jgi:hypothetical protein
MTKKIIGMPLTLLFNCPTFFGLGEFGLFECYDFWFFVRVITISLALVTGDNPGQKGCIIRGDMMKLLADVATLLLLTAVRVRWHVPLLILISSTRS